MQDGIDVPVVQVILAGVGRRVRGRKLMMCVEFVSDRKTKATFPEEVNIGKLVSNRCEKLGLIVRSIVHLNIMSPAFTITKQQVDFVVDTLRAGVVGVMDDLKGEGIAFGR
jgi:adenosylmethionine-8-amino-7-oxononanoate aminotransferase